MMKLEMISYRNPTTETTCCTRLARRNFEAELLGPILPIDLFSLYILLSHFRTRDVTRGNSFFQMSSYARANVRITKENSHEGISCMV